MARMNPSDLSHLPSKQISNCWILAIAEDMACSMIAAAKRWTDHKMMDQALRMSLLQKVSFGSLKSD